MSDTDAYALRFRGARFLALRALRTAAFGEDSSPARKRRMTVAISIADLAAPPPRLNLVGSDRSIACAIVCVVSTPKMIGTSESNAACPETDYRIKPPRPCHRPCHQGNFERPRHPYDLDVFVLHPVFGQPLNAGTQQLTRRELIEFRDDNPKRNPVAS